MINYKLVHRSPAKCGTSSSLFTNFKRRLSTSVPIYGKSHCCLMNSKMLGEAENNAVVT